ncbi:discoidin domain-containing protein [Lysinibacillus sp. Ag94]|uniref:discoidin domain-containing protein n=1 Tax=Lysinibacillus sp. Ag94 TaxID=2936682 RepID=UPI00200E1241|nr:discoidin domain-containing protein [Lysinibacillus sp. Ag94]UPW81590.1 discoidin domain-containing protein [Lysinibacillus sp. Ag94]
MDKTIIEYTWFTLAMTSNTTPTPYVASASSSMSANPPYLAFDNMNTSDSRWISSSPICHITLDFGSVKLFNCLKYKCPSLVKEAYPKLVTIQGSNDGTNFIDIATFNGINTSTDFMIIEFENNTRYRYYRFNIKSNFGHTSYSGLNEIVYGFIKIPINKTLILHDGEYKKFNGYIPAIPPSVSSKTIIPAMTSNTSPSGKAFSNKNPESAFRLFDGNYSSAYPMSYRQQDAIIGYNFMKEVKIVKYGLICAKYYGLSAWKFEGSSDGVNWTTLDSQTGQSWNEGGEKIYTITSSNYYERYRINFSKTQNFESTSFYELKMYEYIEEIPSIPYYWSTVSSTLPNSTEFLEKGMNNLSPLFDRTITQLEPIPMTQRNDTLVSGEVGKVFSKTLDLKKYFDIRTIRTEMR